MKMFRKDEGFTLVELMVVVLIIGILVAIAIPVFNAASASARLRTCQSNQRMIEGAIQQYVAASPDNTVAQCDGVLGTAATGATMKLLNATTPYIKSEPKCPSNFGTAPAQGLYTIAAGTVTMDGVNLVAGVTAISHAHY